MNQYVPQEEKEPIEFDFQDPSPPPMKAVCHFSLSHGLVHLARCPWSSSWSRSWTWSWLPSHESGVEPFKFILTLLHGPCRGHSFLHVVMLPAPQPKTSSSESPPESFSLQCEITYLSSVGSISWKYLTPKRPHDAKTEPFFSRSANYKQKIR